MMKSPDGITFTNMFGAKPARSPPPSLCAVSFRNQESDDSFPRQALDQLKHQEKWSTVFAGTRSLDWSDTKNVCENGSFNAIYI
jgi:hypothetical protein